MTPQADMVVTTWKGVYLQASDLVLKRAIGLVQVSEPRERKENTVSLPRSLQLCLQTLVLSCQLSNHRFLADLGIDRRPVLDVPSSQSIVQSAGCLFLTHRRRCNGRDDACLCCAAQRISQKPR